MLIVLCSINKWLKKKKKKILRTFKNAQEPWFRMEFAHYLTHPRYWAYAPIFLVGLKSITIYFSYRVETKLLMDGRTNRWTPSHKLSGLQPVEPKKSHITTLHRKHSLPIEHEQREWPSTCTEADVHMIKGSWATAYLTFFLELFLWEALWELLWDFLCVNRRTRHFDIHFLLRPTLERSPHFFGPRVQLGVWVFSNPICNILRV